MLNPFPIQFLTLLAYFLLRLTVGGTLLYLGRSHIKHFDELKRTMFSIQSNTTLSLYFFVLAEIIFGTLTILGAFTQYAMLGIILYALFSILMKQNLINSLFPPPIYNVILLGVAISLFITGAGAFAFDLPL